MSSKSKLRRRSLDSGVTPRRLYQVVLPEPGSPIARTTYPRGSLGEMLVCSAGGVESESGCVSTTILFSGSTGIVAVTLGIGVGAGAGLCGASDLLAADPGSAWRTANGSGYEGLSGAGWLEGSSCPLLPVDSDSFGPRLERLLMRSRIQSRILRIGRL